MPRRVVFSNYDSPANPFYGGGGGRAIHEVARRLASRHQVRVITGRYSGCRAEVVDGVEYAPLGSERAGPKLGQLLFQFLLPRQTRRERFDVWIESLTPPFSTACLPLVTRRPVIALTQVLAGKAMARKYKLPFGVLEHLGLKCYRYGIALSTYLAGELRRANPRMRVVVIPNGVEREFIRQTIAKDEAHVLFLGRLDVRQKGLDLLLAAVSRVATRLTVPVVLAGAGSPKDEAYVARQIRALGLEGKVRAIGHVAGAARHEALRRALFLVLPSRFEASPLVLAEAFCYELPVVMFGIPELAELPEACCVKTTPFDIAALGEALVALAQDGPRRLALGGAAKAFARGLDWDDLAARYEDFFESILQTG